MSKLKHTILFAVLALVGAFALFNRHWGLLIRNPVTELAAGRGYFFPEELAPGQWAFWCLSGNPGIDSQASHFVLASNFAKQHKLKYLGPLEYKADWSGWPTIFVALDGTYKEVDIYGYEFNLFGNMPFTTVCWVNGKAVIAINADKTLQVMERK